MKKQVWGIGTLAMDVLMKVDTLPKEDGFCMVESTEHQPGGSGTNVMVQMARLGAACGYTGAVVMINWDNVCWKASDRKKLI